MANRLELMAANVCQMLKQLVHTAGIPAPGKCDQDSKETDPRIALKIAAIAYGDLTPAVQYAWREPRRRSIQSRRETTDHDGRNTLLTTSSFGGEPAGLCEWFNGVEIVCC
jgi:hypothetical protein